jgi:transposase
MSLPITPLRSIKHKEADTVKKSRFFKAYDSQNGESLQTLATKYGITKRTACNWLNKRRIQGSTAYRRTRKLSKRLGRKPALTNKQI